MPLAEVSRLLPEGGRRFPNPPTIGPALPPCCQARALVAGTRHGLLWQQAAGTGETGPQRGLPVDRLGKGEPGSGTHSRELAARVFRDPSARALAATTISASARKLPRYCGGTAYAPATRIATSEAWTGSQGLSD
jgi:hypothetical protein